MARIAEWPASLARERRSSGRCDRILDLARLHVIASANHRFLLAALVFCAGPILARPAVDSDVGPAEAQLRLVVEKVRQGSLGSALREVDRLIAQYPNFRLAHLVQGDLLRARAGPIDRLGNTGHAGGERLDELRAEALARLRAYNDRPPPGHVPRYLLRMGPSQKHAIVVDASRFRAFVFENVNGTPRLVEDFYATLGKNGIEKLREGDRKTPIGVYHVTSLIPGAKLPDLYGWGALPINYPNEWDQLAGKTGYGIWLHGVPSDTYARAPRGSDGCIALANPDIERLTQRVRVGTTPVIIADRVEWVPSAAARAESAEIAAQLEAWRKDWESLDSRRYLAHYAATFRSGDMALTTWTTHKRRVNAGKKWIRVSLENVSVLRSPGRDALISVSFDQDYRSNNLSRRTAKRQYWAREGGRWKIAYEGLARSRPVVLPESYPGKRRAS
jgi:murein L,D-transpeptidase YafK